MNNKTFVAALFVVLCALFGCSDYEQMLEDDYGFLRATASDPTQNVPTVPSSGKFDYGTLIDSRDGSAYKTIVIGSMTWMAENLNFNPPEYAAKTFCYGDNLANCTVYGRLYTWAAAMDSLGRYTRNCFGCGRGVYKYPGNIVRGLCPEGWHVPKDEEWDALVAFVGESPAPYLKSTSWDGLDTYGFNVLASGFMSIKNGIYFVQQGNSTGFWTSTESHDYNSHTYQFIGGETFVNKGNIEKANGRSIRCVMNSGTSASPSAGNPGVSQIVSSSSAQAVSSGSTIKDGSKYDATAKTLTDLRDNKTYKTVTIGTQTWMAENLNYEYNKGTAKSFCFNNSADSCAKYGRLYLWSAAMDSAAVFSTAGKGCGYGKACGSSGTVRGVCPENWHLPSSDEWSTLISAGGGIYSAGASLKSGYGWKSGGNGVDSFGFAILPAGYRHASGAFQDVGVYGDFWSSSVGSGYSAYYLNFDYNYKGVTRDNLYVENFGYSVRCLKDSN